MKSPLKINNMMVDCMLIRRNEAIKHKTITIANRNANKPFNIFTCSLPPLLDAFIKEGSNLLFMALSNQ
jgi:hypothetical protein